MEGQLIYTIQGELYMANVNKIVKHELQDEVLKLRDEGLGLQEIRNIINRNHDDVDISHMCVKRFLENYKVKLEEKKIDEGVDTWEDLRGEFREKMDDLEDETREIYLIMKKSLKQIIKEGDSYKTIKAAKDTLTALDQQKRNWIDLIQWGVNEFKPRNTAQTLNITKINNMFIELSDKLCPTCRSKIIDIITNKD